MKQLYETKRYKEHMICVYKCDFGEWYEVKADSESWGRASNLRQVDNIITAIEHCFN